MSKRILTAKAATVNFGCIFAEGLIDEEGDYYVTIPQLVDLFKVSDSIGLKKFDLAMRKVLSSKLQTPLSSEPVDALCMLEFELLVTNLDRDGNKVAQELRSDLFALSLHQSFADAFGRRLSD
jgi:hypothetical protein